MLAVFIDIPFQALPHLAQPSKGPETKYEQRQPSAIAPS
jgi:hypothetical protein